MEAKIPTRKLCLLVTLMLCFSGAMMAQFVDVKTTDGASFCQGRSIASSSNDETMTVGAFVDVLDLADFSGPLLNPSGSGTKGFLFKVNSSGNYDWAFTFVGTGGGCIVEDVVYDEDNDIVYVTGTVRDELVIYNDINVAINGTTSAFSGTGENLFVVSFPGNGSGYSNGYLGVGSFAEGGEGLVIHNTSGNVGLTGFFTEYIDYYPLGSNSVFSSWSSSGFNAKDVLVTSFTSDLVNVNFNASLEGDGDDIGYGIGFSSSGHLFVTGQFEGSIRALSASGSFSPYFSAPGGGGSDIFICKFKHPGNYEWLSTAGSSETDASYDLVTLHEPGPTDGISIITGKYTTDLSLNDFNQNPTINVPHGCAGGLNQMMVAGYDPTGIPIWADWVESCLAASGPSNGAIGQSLSLLGQATDVVFVAGQVENYSEAWGTYNGGSSGAGIPGVLDSDIGSIVMRIHVPYLTGDYSSALIFANNSDPLFIDHDPGFGVAANQNSCNVYLTGALKSYQADFQPLTGIIPGSCTGSPCATQAYWGYVGCSSFKNAGTSTVGDEVSALGLSLFPNPTTGWLTIRLPEGALPQTTLQLIDLQGRVLVQAAIGEGRTEHELDLGDLPAGMYHLAILQPDQNPEYLTLVKQ